MRTTVLTRSVLSRSVVAVASLAIASAGLGAAPADAASTSAAVTSAGVTRDMVLTAAAGYRTQEDATYAATMTAARSIVNRACAVNADIGESIGGFEAAATDTVSSADGIFIISSIQNVVDETYRLCVVGAVAATAPTFTLQGSVTVTTGPTTVTAPLSGDVTTSAFAIPNGQDFSQSSLTASGTSLKVTKGTTSTKVKDKKTKAEKKKAKEAYAKRLKAAKKAYEKALKKAGSSKSKKAAAKKAYAKTRASAKAKYKYAIAGYKLVRKTASTTDSRPFAITNPSVFG